MDKFFSVNNEKDTCNHIKLLYIINICVLNASTYPFYYMILYFNNKIKNKYLFFLYLYWYLYYNYNIINNLIIE